MNYKILCIALLLFSCNKKKNFNEVLVIGHGATGLEMTNAFYHYNTAEGIEYSLGIEGCDGVELDLQMAKDGTLWLYHDSSLESETNGNSCVPNLNKEELQQVRYKTLKKEKLVRLDALNFDVFKHKTLFLDIRHLNACNGEFVSMTKMIESLEFLKAYAYLDLRVICILGYENWIEAFDSAGYEVAFPIYDMAEVEQLNVNYPMISGYIMKNKAFSKSEVEEIKSSGKKIFIFEVRSPKGIRSALKKSPDALITDDVKATLIEKY